jgi:eukaryotic-like serine/threonine-protein kinase
VSGIFISYRRSDSPDATGRLYDRLVSEFGKAQVFKDVDSIPLGRDFRGHLNDIVGACGVMLAIIGPHWADAHNPAGQRRLEDPEDFVRIELETALARDIPVVPVLVGHAPLPGASELPGSLGALVFRQSIEVRPDPDFHTDATRLVTALRAILDPEAAAAEQAAAARARSAAAAGRGTGRWPGWIVAALGITAAVLGITAAVLAVPTIRYLRETPPPETRLDLVTPATSEPDSFALSPDGRQIVFVASGDGPSRLWLRSLASTTAQPLAGTEGATLPFWSPDSRSIGFFAHGALNRLDLGGGGQQVLAPAPDGEGGTWSAAGVILFAPFPGRSLMRVSATGGAAREVATLEAGVQIRPFFLPDGHHFLFEVSGSDTGGVYLGDLTGGAPTRLTSAPSSPVYLPTGWMLWVRDGALVAQRLDVAKAALTGAPVTLAGGLPAGEGVISVTVSATGRVAYRVGGGSQSQLTWFDRSGAVRGSVVQPDGALFDPRVAPDGRRVVVGRITAQGQNIWLLDGARVSRLTFGAHADFLPVWSPDGTRIVFTSNRSSAVDLYQKRLDGAVGEVQPLLSSGQFKGVSLPDSWSPDGRFLLYNLDDPQTGAGDLWVIPMVGAHTPSVFLKTPFDAEGGVFSPDGRWVAYQSNESGRNEIYVRPFHPPGEKSSETTAGAMQWQVSTAGGVYPTWRPDGREIDYIDPSGAMMAAPITVRGAELTVGTPVKLFQTRIVGGGANAQSESAREYDVAPDGRFLINTVSASAAAPITLIQNWSPGATPQ